MEAVDGARLFAEAACRPGISRDDIAKLAPYVMQSLSGPDDPAMSGVMAELAPAILSAPPEIAPTVAALAGLFAETGADPGAAGPAFVQRFLAAVHGARALFDAAAREAGPPAADETDEAEDDFERLSPVLDNIRPRMPAEASQWDLLENFLASGNAIFGISPSARVAAASAIPDLRKLAPYHQSASWFLLMLQVLDNEPYVALEPATGLGIRGRMSGISVNFQLNVLLMDAFPQTGFRPKPRVSRRAVEIALGNGPQEADETVTAAWDLCTWTSIRPGNPPAGPQKMDSDNWIWNEGTPADIPVFDGERVIVLGPPSYARSWRAQRDFAFLKAELTVEHRLSKAEVQDLVARLASAPRPG